MNVNDDFSVRVVVHGARLSWEDSPMPGVQRRRLDRVNHEHDRVTTIVRYAPGSHFSPHTHDGGEEFIVLEGIFEDDYGQWPVGSYIRNPPQSRHKPGSTDGCVILVKLWQFDPADRTFIHANIHKIGAVSEQDRPGVRSSPLYADSHEDVRVEHWAPAAAVTIDCPAGAELFVLSGGFTEGADRLSEQSWLRAPSGSAIQAAAGEHGATVWIKSGHLSGL